MVIMTMKLCIRLVMEAGMPIVKISRAMVPEMWISWMDERHQKSKTNGSPDAERTGFFCGSFVFFAKQSGDDGASAKSEDISEGDHQREYGNSQGNTGHQVLFAGECNEVGIYHVVDERDHHTEYDRKCEREIRFWNRRCFKKFVFHKNQMSFLCVLAQNQRMYHGCTFCMEVQ